MTICWPFEFEDLNGVLPDGVIHRGLNVHDDERGSFAEVFRNEWDTGIVPMQWNVVHSGANVLRGIHVHVDHDDYLLVIRGHATIGLQDMRVDAPTFGTACTVELRASRLAALTIPHGVAHGFLFNEPSTHVYAVNQYWNLGDELGCHYRDRELKIPWVPSDPVLSERDAHAGGFSEMLERLTLGRRLRHEP